MKHLLMAVHAGRHQNKTRGATTLDDHPDALWYLSRSSDTRIFRAMGRDVNLDEGPIEFIPESGAQIFVRGGSVSGALDTIKKRMKNTIQFTPNLSATELDSKVKGNTSLKPKARLELVSSGELIENIQPGTNRKTYSLPLEPN